MNVIDSLIFIVFMIVTNSGFICAFGTNCNNWLSCAYHTINASENNSFNKSGIYNGVGPKQGFDGGTVSIFA